jgi:hypothetical protein
MQYSRSLFIRTDVLRLLHSALLLEFGSETAARFWKCAETEIADIFPDLSGFLQHIWIPGTNIPTEVLINLFNRVEPFVNNLGLSVSEFARTVYLGSWTSLLPAVTLVKVWAPFIDRIVRKIDYRRSMLRAIVWTVRLSSKDACINIISQHTSADFHEDIMMFSFDKSFTVPLPLFDYETWLGTRFKTQSVPFSFPEYEELITICNPLTPKQILSSQLRIDKNAYLLNNKVIGKQMYFKTFIAGSGINLRKFDIDQTKIVMIASENVYCPIRKRNVIQKGCAYGTPVYLFKIRYAHMHGSHVRRITSFVAKRAANEHLIWEKLQPLHNECLNLICSVYKFTFIRSEETLNFNGSYLIKNVPALILCKLLIAYTKLTPDVERRTIIADPEIVKDRSNPNLEPRFILIAKALSLKCPGVRLVRVRKGVVRLESDSKIEFNEI